MKLSKVFVEAKKRLCRSRGEIWHRAGLRVFSAEAFALHFFKKMIQ